MYSSYSLTSIPQASLIRPPINLTVDTKRNLTSNQLVIPRTVTSIPQPYPFAKSPVGFDNYANFRTPSTGIFSDRTPKGETRMEYYGEQYSSYTEVDDRSPMTPVQNNMSPTIIVQPKNPPLYRSGTMQLSSHNKSPSIRNYSEDFTVLSNQYNAPPSQYNATPNQLINNLAHRNTPSSYQSTNEVSATLRLPTINMGSKNHYLKRQGSMDQFARETPVDSRAKVLEKIVFGQNEKIERLLNHMNPEPPRSMDNIDFKSNTQLISALKPPKLKKKSEPGFNFLMNNSPTIHEEEPDEVAMAPDFMKPKRAKSDRTKPKFSTVSLQELPMEGMSYDKTHQGRAIDKLVNSVHTVISQNKQVSPSRAKAGPIIGYSSSLMPIKDTQEDDSPRLPTNFEQIDSFYGESFADDDDREMLVSLTNHMSQKDKRGKEKSIRIKGRIKKEKKKTSKKLQRCLWALVYPTLLHNCVSVKVEARKKVLERGITKKIQEQKDFTVEFIKTHCFASLESLYSEKKSLTIINEDEDKEISNKDLNKRLSTITEKLSDILGDFSRAVRTENMKGPFIKFFAEISCEQAVLPHKFLTEFEISCLKFSHLSTLKNMSPMRTKMLIGLFMLVKVLIYTFLTQPWTVFPKLKKSTKLVKKLKSCSSVLYHVIMEKFRENLKTVPNNQALIPPEKRLVARNFPLVAFESSNTSEDYKEPSEDMLRNEVIVGLYTREAITNCLSEQTLLVDKLRGSVEDCLDKLYEQVSDAQDLL